MSFDLKSLAVSEWNYLKTSGTLKAIAAFEVAAVSGLVWSLVSGEEKLDRHTLLVFAFTQACAVVGILLRRSLAGLEAKLDALLGQGTSAEVEKKVLEGAVALLVAKGHPEAAKVIQAEAAKPSIPVTDPSPPTPAMGA